MFRISRSDLELAGFEIGSEFETIAEKGVLFLVKKCSRASEWIFKNTRLNQEDKMWLESKLND